MSAAAVALLAVGALLCWPVRSPVAVRARWLAGGDGGARAPGPPAPGQSAPGQSAPGPAGTRRWLLAGAAGVAAGVLVGGTAGMVVAGLVVVGGERLLRRGGREGSRAGPAPEADLPVACDLLAVCLEAGLPVGGALAAVATALPGPLGPELATVAGLYRLGAAPRRAWADVPPGLAAPGRVLVRAGESGSTVVPALRSLAADVRAGERSRADAAVRRAGVWVLAPLGACFLPAFLCLGVVPLVLGIAADVFG
ncbi:Type II secretion system (T2SS), protein F [Geodermatophilus africanus]|uniref:Type II secretion system (T2SS), protein F n=1 Tax=Geodermatophilus africanus TaxID=1137993 RepID=A0A1H3GJ57_9ACTN|nr:type II secretion system F family protein [Geodermatophilus africanus]SDY03311.1 Type II secretion system (T2SS), protein F [Geodermatophilus africanus]